MMMADSVSVAVDAAIAAERARAAEETLLACRELRFGVAAASSSVCCGCCGCGKKKAATKTILCGVDIALRRGALIALIGASGAGKTTLLNALAGRAGSQHQQRCFLEGRVASGGSAAYITQEDTMVDTLTPREVVRFAAELSSSSSSAATKEQRDARVEALLAQFHLLSCADTVVGTPGEKRGISGGERKRVSIAMALAKDPQILFVDEPTSGLDSSAALNVVRILRRIADDGRAVVVTVHQPSDALFALFTDVCILARGRVAFFGPRTAVADHFAALGFVQPPHEPTAAWLIDLVDTNRETLGAGGLTPEPAPAQVGSLPPMHTPAFVEALADHFAATPLAEQTRRMADAAIATLPRATVSTQYARSQLAQTAILCRRSAKALLRDKGFFVMRIAQTVGVAALLCVIYCKMTNNQAGIRSRMGFMFFTCMVQFLFAMLSVLFVVPKELAVLLREHLDGMYRVNAWVASKLIVDTPMQVLMPLLFGVIVYWSVNLNESWDRVLIFLAIMVLLANVGSSLGFFVSACTWNMNGSLAITPALFIPNVVFAGFVVDLSTVTVVLRWIQWVSFLKYAFGTLVYNEFKGLTFYCEASEEPQPGYCPLTTGDQVLAYYDFTDVPVLWYAVALLGYIVVMRGASVIAMIAHISKFKSHR